MPIIALLYIFSLLFLKDTQAQDLQNTALKFSVNDSLFVEVINGQRYLRHRLKKGQTLYAICTFYSVKISELYFNNPSLEVNDLKIGQIIRVPMLRAALLIDQDATQNPSNYLPIYYKVKPKETLYRVAKIHFQIPVEELKGRNALSDNALNEGMHLKIAWINARGIPDSLQANQGLSGLLGEESQRNQKLYKASYNGRNEQLAEGIACWDKQMQLSSKNKLYVMSSIVKKGKYIRIDNPMTKRFLYAKVVANKPQNSFTKDALIVLTPTVAKALGALDARFFVRIFYCEESPN